MFYNLNRVNKRMYFCLLILQPGGDERTTLEKEKKEWEERCRKLMSYIALSTKV